MRNGVTGITRINNSWTKKMSMRKKLRREISPRFAWTEDGLSGCFVMVFPLSNSSDTRSGGKSALLLSLAVAFTPTSYDCPQTYTLLGQRDEDIYTEFIAG